MVASGEALLAPAVTRRLIEDFSPCSAGPRRRASRRGRTDAARARGLGAARPGLSNSEIADSLVVGETTVKTHVARVLMKLGLRDRVQAVVLAYESGLVTPGKAPDA